MESVVELQANGHLCSACGNKIDDKEPGHMRMCKACKQKKGVKVKRTSKK
jgi:NADH pyrophosphatase NudC (nudix superfamily)